MNEISILAKPIIVNLLMCCQFKDLISLKKSIHQMQNTYHM